MQLGEYKLALSTIKSINKSKYSNSDYLNLAFLKEKVGKTDQALDAYKYVLKSNKWKNTSHTKAQITDKIRELEVQLRAVANVKSTKGKKN